MSSERDPFLTTTASRRATVAILLSLYSFAAIVVYTTTQPTSPAQQVVLFVGVFYHEAVTLLKEFAEVSDFDALTLNILYGLGATGIWAAGSYLLDYYGFTSIEGGLAIVLGAIGVVIFFGIVVGGLGAQYVALSLIAATVAFITVYVP